MNNEAFYLVIGIVGFMFGLISWTHSELDYKGYESAHSCTGAVSYTHLTLPTSDLV